jgi:hypothetical protein
VTPPSQRNSGKNRRAEGRFELVGYICGFFRLSSPGKTSSPPHDLRQGRCLPEERGAGDDPAFPIKPLRAFQAVALFWGRQRGSAPLRDGYATLLARRPARRGHMPRRNTQPNHIVKLYVRYGPSWTGQIVCWCGLPPSCCIQAIFAAYRRAASLACWARHGRGCSSGVEHNLAKVGVEGSNPFARSKFPKGNQ